MIENAERPISKPPPPPLRRKGRWGRRIGIALLLLPLLAIIAHGIWNYTIAHGLTARIAAIRATGEPIFPSDFAPPVLAPGENGGPDIAAAAEAMLQYYRTTGKSLADMDLGLPLRPEERAAIEKALADLAPAMAQFEQGRRAPNHQPTLNLNSPVLSNIMLAPFNGVRALAKHHGYAALLAHEKGDDATALRRIDDIILISRYTDKNPSLVGHLVSIGCLALATQQVFDIAPDLRIGAANNTDAAPANVRKMIDQFLDDAPPREGLRLAFRGERMAQLDTMDALSRGVPIQMGPPGAAHRLPAVRPLRLRPDVSRQRQRHARSHDRPAPHRR